MKVILLQHVPGFGKKGDIKEVSDGYFRNQLAPKKLAMIASDGAMRSVQNQIAKTKEKQEKSLESAQFIHERLKDKAILLNEKVSDSGNLYAAVHEKEIVQAIQNQHGIELSPKSLHISEPIKHLGQYVVAIDLHPKVKFSINLQINAL